jgi:hypothetical protein
MEVRPGEREKRMEEEIIRLAIERSPDFFVTFRILSPGTLHSFAHCFQARPQ